MFAKLLIGSFQNSISCRSGGRLLALGAARGNGYFLDSNSVIG